MDDNKLIRKRHHGVTYHLSRRFVNNWCLKRSRVLYHVAKLLTKREVRINIAMRCRTQSEYDWGHAWVTIDGRPLCERNLSMANKPKMKISDTGKYTYWIYE